MNTKFANKHAFEGDLYTATDFATAFVACMRLGDLLR
jgi:hypothetical protein